MAEEMFFTSASVLLPRATKLAMHQLDAKSASRENALDRPLHHGRGPARRHQDLEAHWRRVFGRLLDEVFLRTAAPNARWKVERFP